jgi:hypothetical protein
VRSSVEWYPTPLSRALAAEFDAIRVVDDAVEDGVGEGRIADHVVPVIDGHLACGDGGARLITILNDLQKFTALLVAELLGPQSSRMSRSVVASALRTLGWRPLPRASARMANSLGRR